MYNAVFEADNGRKYVFGVDGETAFDMDIGNGITVDIGKSQGFLQVGETVENFTVTGRPIEVKGVIYGDIAKKKREMRVVFAPFVSGKLTIQGKYYIRVYVQDTPSFSPAKDNGRFTMVLFAPYPFFYSTENIVKNIGNIEPMFSFPVNYAEPHQFGRKNDQKYVNLLNEGDVNVPFSVYIRSSGASTNVTLRNLENLKYLRLNGALSIGDAVNVYRDDKNILRAELTRDGEMVDIISWIDEGSDLFELDQGTNIITFNDDENGANLDVTITFNPAVVAVYED